MYIVSYPDFNVKTDFIWETDRFYMAGKVNQKLLSFGGGSSIPATPECVPLNTPQQYANANHEDTC